MRKPWQLAMLASGLIVLAVFVIIAALGGDGGSEASRQATDASSTPAILCVGFVPTSVFALIHDS